MELVTEDQENVSAAGSSQQRQMVRVMPPGEVFAYREMLTKVPHTRTTRARGHVELLALSHDDLSRVRPHQPLCPVRGHLSTRILDAPTLDLEL